MKYAAYLEIPNAPNYKFGTFRTRLFYFDKKGAGDGGNGDRSALDLARLGYAPNIICRFGLRAHGIIFPEMRLVTGFLPSERNFISRDVFTLLKVEVRCLGHFQTIQADDNTARTETEEVKLANRLVKINALAELGLSCLGVSVKQEVIVENYWRTLFMYNG
ncbi:MAG: hypothetical protein ACR2HG_11200 [Pyrinomonadaceae bacterium]